MRRDIDHDYCVAAAEIVSLLINAVPEKAKRVKEGVMNINIRVDTNIGSYLVRMYPPGREGILEFEPGLIKRMAQYGMRVPNFVGSSMDGPSSNLLSCLRMAAGKNNAGLRNKSHPNRD